MWANILCKDLEHNNKIKQKQAKAASVYESERLELQKERPELSFFIAVGCGLGAIACFGALGVKMRER
jgi:hypothetical protein